MRFHVLGLGPVGTLVAHNLRNVLPREHEIILIHGTKRLARRQRSADGVLRIEHNGIVSTSAGYESEVMDEFEVKRGPPKGKGRSEWSKDTLDVSPEPLSPPGLKPLQPIESLFITVKARSTLPLLTKLLPRISENSTIVLLQHGLGVYEQLIQEIFRNPENRPHFILASNSHRAWLKNYSQVVHNGIGQIDFGIVPDPNQRDFEVSMKDEKASLPDRPLRLSDITSRTGDPHFARYRSLRLTVAAMLAMETLYTKWRPIAEVQETMRQRLVVQSVIGPLAALMGCRNGDLFTQEASLRTTSRICAEAAVAYECEMKNATQKMLDHLGDPENEQQMPLGRVPRSLEQSALYNACLHFAKTTAGQISPMLVDVRNGRPTDIEYLNGYLLRLGKANQVPMPGNAMLVNLIKMRSAIPLDQML